MLSPYPGFGKPQKWDREQAARSRRLHGQPEPFGDRWQEQFLQTLLMDRQFRLAVKIALDSTEGI